MRKLLKKLLCASITASILLTLAAYAAPADYNAATPEILSDDFLYGRSDILINADNGDILFEKSIDERRYPASTTKIMTCILGIESGLLGQYVTIPNGIAVSSDSSKMGITTGDRMLFDDLLYGMMLASGNDAALAVAILVSGSEAQFVRLMNEKAAELGMNNTHFANPHGLHNVNHYTTARDLAVLTAYAMKDNTFRDIVAAEEHTVTSDFWPNGTKFTTKYDLLLKDSQYYYEPCIGVKTGYTKTAGRCFVGAAEDSGITLVSVCLNPVKENEKDKTYKEAFTDTIRLFNYGYSLYEMKSFSELLKLCDTSMLTYRVEKASKSDSNNGYMAISITDIPGDYTEGYLKADLENAESAALVASRFASRIRIELNNGSLTAPLSKGDIVGKVYFTGNDGNEYIGTAVASRDIEMEPPTMNEIMDTWISENAPWMFKLMPRTNPISWILYIAIVILLIRLLGKRARAKRRKNRARKAAYEKRRREYLRRMEQQEYARKQSSVKKKTNKR